ncbi:hypothetical protein [Agreia sp. COWG]|uniref:hypothetical protein n=1 Tax=Agreia sp. COWG TaxID=2773266 RepID=UPI00192659A3|nr:hypothetical protein [Agreia sp. COWG]
MTSSSLPTPTPHEARELLDRADGLGRQAVARASWPSIAFLLGLGAMSSIGCLGLGVTTGTAYFAIMFGMIAWLAVLMTFFLVFKSSAKRGFTKRWNTYMGIWSVSYLIAVVANAGAEGTRLWLSCLTAALLLVATTTCAWYEARR